MKRFYLWAKNMLFSDNLDFRAHIFNTLGLLGFALGVGFGLYYIYNFSGMGNIVGNFIAAAVAIAFIIAANYTKAFKRFFLLTIIVVFLVIFPVLFFVGGGYHSSMPCFFVFAVVFTVLMLEGWQRTVFTILEFALYLGCFAIAFCHPKAVVSFPTEADMVRDIVIGCIAASAVLAIAIYRHIVIYDRKQKDLEKANAALSGLDRMKTEFFQNMNHDMKTPLTVISTFVGNADDMLDHDIDKREVKECLEEAQEQIQILARMVEHSLTLAAAHEGKYHMETLDFAVLLRSGAGAFHPSLRERGNTLDINIPDGLPKITGNDDLLKRTINNIMTNAAKHTQNGKITVSLEREGGDLITTITDTGGGIDPALLPRVFERGVSGYGATGYGLAICKAIVETHSGEIHIESEPGKGTAVRFTLPLSGEAAL